MTERSPALAATPPASRHGKAGALMFEDPASRALLADIRQLGPSEAAILVTGETGTGKELAARHLHAVSPRRDGPFVAVNCGAIPETLIEAELFGHEKGVYTGASAARAGWFEVASGGTLFLDEIGDLPLAMQVKLLRVLQEREVVPVGSRKPVPVDIRLVAATNVDLVAAIAAGRFREDLFYRIAVATIRLPPLRARTGDILPLARHFLRQHVDRLGKPPYALSSAAERALLAHSWPGNIRELENVIHRAVLVCGDDLVAPHHLGLPGSLPGAAPAAAAPDAPQGAAALDGIRDAVLALLEDGREDLLDHVVETTVRTAFEFCHRNQVQTATALGITRNVLRSHLARLGVIPRRTAPDLLCPAT